MLVATGNDVRVMSIKLADRLHNMRTLGVMRPEKQARIAKVTRDVLIPLAERLGVQALKTELEDLVFAILHPEEYAHTRAVIADNAGAAPTRSPRSPRTCARCCARPASPPKSSSGRGTSSPCTGSRLKRGELRGTDFGRLLVLVDEDADCYAVLGELHTCFTPVDLRVQGLHRRPQVQPVPVAAHRGGRRPDGEVAEVLIRTHQMHKVAEAGRRSRSAIPTPPTAGRRAPDPPTASGPTPPAPAGSPGSSTGSSAAPDPDTFWTTLRDDLAQDREITVFRADGGTLGLPAGASCVDAAYAQYGEDAHACIGARVNGRLAHARARVLQRRRHRPAAHAATDAGLRPSPGLARARPHPRRPHRHHRAGSPPIRSDARSAPSDPAERRRARQAAARPSRRTGRPATRAGRTGRRRRPARTRPYGSPAAARPCRPTRSPASRSAAAPSPCTGWSARPAPAWPPQDANPSRSDGATEPPPGTTAPPSWPRPSAAPGCWPT